MTLPRKINQHTYQTFVNSKVQTLPITKEILTSIMPYFPLHFKVISGYVGSEDQYWKVNYHWEYLGMMIEKGLEQDISEKHKKCLQAVQKNLLANPPMPPSGYKNDKKMGLTVDKSPKGKILNRWKTLRQCKKDCKLIFTKAKLIHCGTGKPKAWLLSFAPVAKPSTSKHGSGYAIDITGKSQSDNEKIESIAKSLGASLTFKEGSHTHLEFKNGVNVPGFKKPLDQVSDDYSMCMIPTASGISNEQSSEPTEKLQASDSSQFIDVRPSHFEGLPLYFNTVKKIMNEYISG